MGLCGACVNFLCCFSPPASCLHMTHTNSTNSSKQQQQQGVLHSARASPAAREARICAAQLRLRPLQATVASFAGSA